MRKTTAVAVVLVLVFSTILHSNTNQDAIKPKMNDILVHLTELSKLFFQNNNLKNSKTKKAVSYHLKEMSRLIKQVGHITKMEGTGYRISRETLEGHVADLEKVYASGNQTYARWMFQATMDLCMNCHIQVPGASRPHLFDIEGAFTSKFLQAEYYFSTREFEKAMEIYGTIIGNYPKSKVKSDELVTSFERTLAYYARIKQSPQDAIKALQKGLKNSKIPKFVRQNVEGWIVLLKEWENEPPMEISKYNDSILREKVEKLLEPELTEKGSKSTDVRAVAYLRVSGLLYQYLDAHPKTQLTPRILYWLSICDRRLNNNFFFSLANAYLKECMISYPSDPVAWNCFKEYEDEMILSYSGSGGTRLPREVKDELAALKSKLKPQQ